MTDTCNCPDEAGRVACERTISHSEDLARNSKTCPLCGEVGKPVQRQTVKSLLLISLRQMPEEEHLFCATQFCPVVYFTLGGEYTLKLDQLRERVYQKRPESADTPICYCFQYKVGDLYNSTPEGRTVIVEDIHAGIHAGQCACDLRNPQGSCCLGNVQRLIKVVEALDHPLT